MSPRRNDDPRRPTPERLDNAPELAILAALETTLELTVLQLIAIHPQLIDPERPYWARDESKQFFAAERIVKRAHACLSAIRAYQNLCRPPDPPDRHDDF